MKRSRFTEWWGTVAPVAPRKPGQEIIGMLKERHGLNTGRNVKRAILLWEPSEPKFPRFQSVDFGAQEEEGSSDWKGSKDNQIFPIASSNVSR